MGVYELNPSNNFYKGISNPINININISHQTTDLNRNKTPKKDNDTYEDIINKDNISDITQKGESGKTMQIININKMNNYILNSKTNYANYKRVPHKKNEYIDNISPGNNNSFLETKNIKNDIFLTEQFSPKENEEWFKTQYDNFNKAKDINEFKVNEYMKKRSENNTLKQNRNLNNYIKYQNKSQINIKGNNKMIYTKALPIDYNNEKKIENLFILNKNSNDRNNLLYIIETRDNSSKQKINSKKYSTKKDYKNIINKYSYDKMVLAKYLLSLEERQWYIELINISNLLLNKRDQPQIFISDKYIRKIIKLQEQFKWLIESLGIFFNNEIFGSEDYNYNFDSSKYNLPEKDKMNWFRGFKWKGIYIRVMPIEKSKILLNEIKALNYFYFDYLQLLEEYEYIQDNHLLYKLIFPLISYTEINGFILFGSAIININIDENDIKNGKEISNTISELITLNNIIDKNDEVINFYHDLSDSINYSGILKRENKNIKNESIEILEKKYYIKDLLTSRLFSELNIFHFIRINKDKFIIFNLSEFIPNLFEINKSDKILEINFLSIINQKRVYYNTKYIKKTKINFRNSKSSNKSNNENLNPKDVLKIIYNINPYTSQLQTKDVIINDIYFRIIYQAQCIQEKNYKNKQFVDYLFNFNNKKEISNNTKIESGIVEPYVIIYDLNSTIKLKYSLIKSFYGEKNIVILNKLYYLSTNYISFFTSWCEMMNKNSFNIKNYSDLKENMNKYGILSQLKFFSLINITNPEILDIIKISLLVKVIKLSFNKGENDNVITKIKNSKGNNNPNNKLIKYRKTKILYIINSILYSKEAISQSKKFIYNLFEDLVFYVYVVFLKLKLIDGYLSLGLLNINKNNNMNISELSKQITGFDSPKNFLKHIINIAREKPFIFINEMERKLKFVLDPFIKFKSSISIESMYNKIELKHIYLNPNDRTKSFINVEELSGLILAKLIYLKSSNSDSKDSNEFKMLNQRNISDTPIMKGINNVEFTNKTHNNYNNLASKPTFMKPNINLNNFNSPLKSKENSLKITQINPINSINQNNNIDEENNIFEHQRSNYTNDIILNDQNKSNINSAEKDICNNFFIELPSICYKMSYSYENIFTKSRDFTKYLKNIYLLPELNIFNEWNSNLKKLFNGITTSDGEIEHSLLKTLIFLYIKTFFFEKKFNEANQINMNIKDIFKKGNYQLSLQELALINLFQALSSEKYIDSEIPYSKCLMLLLMSYGEPRGRNNDSHGILFFPIWKIARKTFKLEQNGIDEYFKEMYDCLSFYEKKKCLLKLLNTKAKFNYSNNVYNINNTKTLNDICKSFQINNINNKNNNDYNIPSNESRMYDFLNSNTSENPEYEFFLNLSKIINIDSTLSQNIFNHKILENNIIKYFKFPSITSTEDRIDSKFFRIEFIIYILKEIQSLFLGKNIKYNEEYINSNISDEVFNPYPYNYKSNIPYNTTESFTKESYSKNERRNKIRHELFNNDMLKNCEINNMNQLNSNYLGITSKPSFINKLLNNRNNIALINKKSKEEQNTLINKTISTTSNETKKYKGKEKNKNKSVESIKFKKHNLFSHFLYEELLQKLSYKLNAASGIVISFGNNTHNETSHDGYEKINLPRMIYKLKHLKIDHIYSGWEHNIIITNKGDIYSFGNNHQYQCGLPNKNNINKIITNPTNISIINNNIKGKSAACGNEYTLILSKDNEVYAFGNNDDGVLGMNDCKIKKHEFTKINFGIYTNKIKDISAGTVHNLALTQDNKLFSWGSSQGGQLGLPEKYLISQPNYQSSFYLSSPTQISIFSKSKKPENIQKISCGEAHSLALTNDGNVYSWGFGSNGQLGLGFCEDSFEPGTGLTKSRIFVPHLINNYDEENEKIIDIKCGKTFSMFINDKNELFACGVNDLNQLGLNEPFSKEHLHNKESPCYDIVYPIKIDCFLNMKVLKVSCGEGHCLAVIKDLISNIITIWSWGNNKFGQLGQGIITKKTTPNPINYLSDYNSKNFDEISCGGFHSLCLIKYKENLNWIEDDFKKIVNIIDEIGII